MGCDIHLKLEIKPKKDIKVYNRGYGYFISKSKDKWYTCYCFGYDRCWSDRLYGMFAKLANVRNYHDLEHIELRGFPEDACDQTFGAYTLSVLPDETYEEYEKSTDGCNGFYENFCSETKANEWILSKCSEEITINNPTNPRLKENKYITNPDYHSANWCTTQEMEACIDELFKDKNGEYKGDYIEWIALLGLMKGYESTGEYECRAVYWFDN